MAVTISISANLCKVSASGAGLAVAVAPSVSVVTVGGGGAVDVAAEDVSIVDAGGYYTSTDVEGALQEAGAALGAIVEPSSGEGTTVAGGAVNIGGGSVVTAQRDIVLLDTLPEFTIRNQSNTKRISVYEDNIAIAFGSNYFELTELNTFLGIDTTALKMQSKIFYSLRNVLSISAGSISWDMANGQTAQVTLTSSATLQAPTNLPAYGTYSIFPSLEVIQDGTGGHTLSFVSSYKFPQIYITPGTVAGSRTLYSFYLRSDGNIGVVSTYYTA